MLFFCHLLIGILIGGIGWQIFHDRRIIPAAAFGAILPDLIDKPLGHIILAGTLDDGRIYFHGLVVLGIVLVAGLALWYLRHRPEGIALAAGIASHQLADQMWLIPVNWYYPFLGPYPHGSYSGYFGSMLITELTSPTEWLFGAAALLLAIWYFRGPPRIPARLLGLFSLVLVLGGTSVFFSGIQGHGNYLMIYSDSISLIIAGITAFAAGLAVPCTIDIYDDGETHACETSCQVRK